MWMPANFRCLATDDSPGATGLVQFDFDAALGWAPTVYDLSTDPYTSPPGILDSYIHKLDDGVTAVYSAPQGAGLVDWLPDTKGSSKAVSKAFVLPHVLESSGTISKASIAPDPDGGPVIAVYQPQTHAISIAQFSRTTNAWATEVCDPGNLDEDCDALALHLDQASDGTGMVDAALLIVRKSARHSSRYDPLDAGSPRAAHRDEVAAEPCLRRSPGTGRAQPRPAIAMRHTTRD